MNGAISIDADNTKFMQLRCKMEGNITLAILYVDTTNYKIIQ